LGQADVQSEEVTPEMVEAGVSVLEELKGEVSKAYLAKAVFLAMTQARALGTAPLSSSAEPPQRTDGKP
jgi:hypothetical protein